MGLAVMEADGARSVIYSLECDEQVELRKQQNSSASSLLKPAVSSTPNDQ